MISYSAAFQIQCTLKTKISHATSHLFWTLERQCSLKVSQAKHKILHLMSFATPFLPHGHFNISRRISRSNSCPSVFSKTLDPHPPPRKNVSLIELLFERREVGCVRSSPAANFEINCALRVHLHSLCIPSNLFSHKIPYSISIVAFSSRDFHFSLLY